MKFGKPLIAGAWIVAVACETVAVAQQAPPSGRVDRPSLFSAVAECRSLTDPTKRLACYDERVGALDVAEQKHDVVIVDRRQINETKKSLFGFSLPPLRLFSSGNSGAVGKDEGIREINAKIASASFNSRWLVVLEDGARWQQTDDSYINPPKQGQTIRIRKASLGSFFANINDQPAIRVHRLN